MSSFFLRPSSFVLLVLRPSSLRPSSLVLRPLVLLLRCAFDVVFRRKRRRRTRAQGCRDDPGRIGVRPAVVEVAVGGLERPVREEEQILAVGVERRLDVVEVPGRDLTANPTRDVEDEHRRVARAGGASCPREPSRIGRPPERQRLQLSVRHPGRALVHVDDPSLRDLDDADLHRLVDEGQASAVGRPLRRISEPGAQRGDRAFGAGAVGRPQRQLVLAGPIAPIRQRLAVGRPARIALGDARTAREAHHRAVLRGHAEDLATRAERRALARRRHAGRRDAVGDLHAASLERRAIGDDLHRDFRHLVGRQVEQVQAVAGDKHDVGWPQRRRGHVVVLEVRDLPHGAASSHHAPRCSASGPRRGPTESRPCRRATSGTRPRRRFS